MNKHLLVTISDDPAALHGARFVADFFSDPLSLHLTFFYTLPSQAQPGVVPADRVVPVVCGLGDDARLPHDSLEKARQLLCGRGFDKSRMEAKIVFRQYAKILDVIIEGEQGLYDALVLGRRSLGWLEESFGAGVSRGVLEQRASAPLWVCRDIAEGRRGVLLCVDGSPSSLAMADHVGYMLDQERRHRVTLLTVTGPAPEAPGQAVEAMEGAMAALLANGFPEDMVDAKMISSENVGPTLLSEAEEGQYAVVAMGRTGVGLGRYPGLFLGSASDYLYQHLQGASLWVCR